MNLSVFQPVFLAIISCHLLSQAKRSERNMSCRRVFVERLTAERREITLVMMPKDIKWSLPAPLRQHVCLNKIFWSFFSFISRISQVDFGFPAQKHETSRSCSDSSLHFCQSSFKQK